MKYTKEDLQRALEAGFEPFAAQRVAKLIADVRREERERCADIYLDEHGTDNVYDRIRSGE